MSRKWIVGSVVVAATLLTSCGPPRAVPATVAPTASAPPAESGPAPASPAPALRLPRTFLPSGYTARLAIDPERPRFRGAIQIAGNLAERSSVIWLHGYHLAIERAVAQQAGVEVALTVAPRGHDLLEIRAARPLDPGAWTLAFDYTGELDMVNTTGAFKQTVAGRSYVFTQLEAIYARRIFPCFDEPDLKVPWQLTFDIPKPLLAVSNAPQASETALDATTKRVVFAPTKPLSSYLVAFGIGPFEIVDAGRSKRGTPVRIIALAGRTADAAYAAKTSAKILDATEDWFGMPYPYEKLDQLSIPLTAGFGAMENAGLITYTETLILMDPVKTSLDRKRLWTVVAAHEIAHQWFGNLVTPAFWDDIWLNEGFATWLQYKIATRLEPSWREDQSELDTRNHALETDALVHARRIRQPIVGTDDILNAFDGISYGKAASVLNMFESYLGPEVFQRGVRAYLAARAWGTATSTDFLTALGQASGKEVDRAFSTFLEQAGAPAVTTTLTCRGGKAELAMTQERHVPPGAPPAPPGQPWRFPVCVAFDQPNGRGEHCAMLEQPTATIELPTRGCPRWVMPNINGRGYYRNRYTVAQATALRDEAWGRLSWTERRTVFHDVAEGALAGQLPLSLALSLVPRMLAGSDRFAVAPPLDFVRELDGFVPDELRPRYEHWLRTTFGPGAARAGLLGKARDDLDLETTREGLVRTAAWLGRDPALVAQAVELAERWRELPQSTRGLVLELAVDASPAVFARALREAAGEPDRTRRQEMYFALAAVRDPARRTQVLERALDPAIDLREAFALVFTYTTEAGRAAGQQFYRAHHAELARRLPEAETVSPVVGMSRLFTGTCRAEQRDAIAKYVTDTFGPMPGGARLAVQSIEEMDQCIARRKLLEPELRAWLAGIRMPRG